MALAEANRSRHPCINVAFDALNTIPVKHQSGRSKTVSKLNFSAAFLSVYRESVIRALGQNIDYDQTGLQTPML